jgi:hypothetical protein
MNTEQRAIISKALDLGLTYVKSRFAPWSHNVQQEDEATIRQAIAALSPPASAGEGWVLVPRGAVDLAADVAQDWLTLFPEMPGLEKYERFTYGPAVEQLRDDLRAILAAPTPPAAAQEDGRDAARYRWLVENVRWQPPMPDKFGCFPSGIYLVGSMVSAVYGNLKDQCDAAIDAAMLTSPDSGKEGDRG